MKLLYFAWVRQKLGKSEEDFALPFDIKTVSDLLAHLRARGGAYSDAFADGNALRAAVNLDYVKFDAAVSDADEVAFFPPVTGG